MDRSPIRRWRRILSVAVGACGPLLFLSACLPYERYFAAGDPHVQERIRLAGILAMIWRISFFGSATLFVASWLALGLGRWIGPIASLGALFYALATIGAACGPFMCG